MEEVVCMSVGRIRVLAFAVVSMAVGLAAASSDAQDQAPPATVRDYCVKVAPGKGAEFEAFLRDVYVPLSQSRADAGDFAWSLVARAVSPAGSSAACDYRVAYGYKGLPPEEMSREGLDAALKRAKLPLTADQLIAKRSALTSLVSAEIWGEVDAVGAYTEKGSYVRLNHNKVRFGEMGEWVRMERTYWKPLVEAWGKDGGKGGWSLYALQMPGGDSMPYNSLSVDSFPDWNALMQGVPVGEIWPKVHPNMTTTAAFNQLEQVRSVHDVEYYRVIELVRGK
jgi:hypothetical protein